MRFFSSLASIAALAVCITPVLSAPLAEPDVDTTSLVMKRGALSDPAQTCYNGVKQKCDDITVKIKAAVDAKIDVGAAAAIVVDLQAIVALIVKLGVDLQAKIKLGGLAVVDVTACVNIVIAIVNLVASILVKLAASLSVKVGVSVFAAVVVQLQACVKLLINLCINLCLGMVGGLSLANIGVLLGLVAKLTAVLMVFLQACVTLGVSI